MHIRNSKIAMAEKTEESPCFFIAVSSNHFTRLLRLPHVFMRKYESIFPKKAKLRIESGKTWDVKTEQMEDGLFCFTRGWKIFAHDLGLKFGDVLVFTLGDGGCIDVSVFGTNACINDDRDFDVDDDDDNNDDDGQRRLREMKDSLYYEIVLKPHNRYRVTVKREFMRAAGLKGETSVKLVGKKHSVDVTLDNTRKDQNRVDLTLGWADFRRGNDFVYGKTYSFEFKPKENVILVKEVGVF